MTVSSRAYRFPAADFYYVRFSGCQVAFDEMEHSLPSEPNIREELCRNLARNRPCLVWLPMRVDTETWRMLRARITCGTGSRASQIGIDAIS